MYNVGFPQLMFALIAMVTLAIVIDGVLVALQFAMKYVPGLPDQFEYLAAYLLLVGMGSFVCWQGHFDWFTLLGFQWRHQELGWILTGAIIAGGSPLLKKLFKLIGTIPNAISGAASTFGWGGGYGTNTSDDETTKEQATTQGSGQWPV